MSRITDLKRCLASYPTVTPKEVALFCYGSTDDDAYRKAHAMLSGAVKSGVAQRVCAGVYQRAGDWKLPGPVEAILRAIDTIARGGTANDVLPILESGLSGVNR